MNYFYKSKYIIWLTYGLIFTYFTQLMLKSLSLGGRWELNEQIAFGDRVVNGISSYANGITDLFFPSSPYFPGVGYLSAFFQYIGIDNIYINNQLMLIIAVSVGFIYFILLKKLTKKLYPTIPNIVIYFTLILFFITHFSLYIYYMKEFKPDTILLLLATLIFLILEKDKKIPFTHIGMVAILLFITTFFKQSFFIVYFLAFLLIYTNNFFTLKEKVTILLSYAFIGLFALYLIFNIENLYYFTVEILGQHPMNDGYTHFLNYRQGFDNNKIFLLVLMYFLIKSHKQFSIQESKSKYFLFTLVWFIFAAISTAKSGGNIGNFEVGVIVFIPFVIYTLHNAFKRYYSDKSFYILVLIVLALMLTLNLAGLAKGTLKLKRTIQTNQISAKYLHENFNNKSAFIDGETYILAKMAGLNILTETTTIGHFNYILDYDMSHIKNALNEQKYDLIFLKKEPAYFEDIDIVKIMNSRYKIFIDENMPSYLKNKILIRSEK